MCEKGGTGFEGGGVRREESECNKNKSRQAERHGVPHDSATSRCIMMHHDGAQQTVKDASAPVLTCMPKGRSEAGFGDTLDSSMSVGDRGSEVAEHGYRSKSGLGHTGLGHTGLGHTGVGWGILGWVGAYWVGAYWVGAYCIPCCYTNTPGKHFFTTGLLTRQDVMKLALGLGRGLECGYGLSVEERSSQNTPHTIAANTQTPPTSQRLQTNAHSTTRTHTHATATHTWGRGQHILSTLSHTHAPPAL